MHVALDAIDHTVRFLREVPEQAQSWTRLRVRKDWPILVLEIPGGGTWPGAFGDGIRRAVRERLPGLQAACG